MSNNKELNVALVGDVERFRKFAAGLEGKITNLYRDESGAAVLQRIVSGSIQIVAVDEKLTDMDGLSLVNRIAERHPFVNTALVSVLSEHDFHEETEGLGVLMQLPSPPDGEAAEMLIAHYHSIWG